MNRSGLTLKTERTPALPSSVEGIVTSLRELAVVALDAGHPMIAARIAGTADLVEAEARPRLPARPTYRPDC